MGDGLPPADRADLLATIDEEATRLGGFVSNLLDMSRIDAGALKVRSDWVDVADVVRTAVGRARKIMPHHNVVVSLEAELPFIRGDASLLEQAIYNLLDNACKYGGEKDTLVHARAKDGDVIVSVTDEGPGIRQGDIERIFEKFYRGGGGADGRRAGTGLGLSISKGIVEAMGGSIMAQSPAVRRRGARILMRLPAANPPVQGDRA